MRKIASFLVLLLIATAIPLTVLVGQKSQTIKQRAAELPQKQNEIQNLTNQLLENIEKIEKNTTSIQQNVKETILDETIQIAKKRKELLLKTLKTNPQEFINNAVLANKHAQLPQEVKPYVEDKIDIQGSLVVLHIDYFDEKKSTFEYYIKTDKKYKLHFVKDPPRALTDAKIKVTGIALDNNIALVGSTNQEQYSLQIIAQATLPPTLGEQKIAVILANFTTNKSQPISTSKIKEIMFQDTHSKDSLDSFYKENSFDKISFNGDVFGWYTISTPTICNFFTLSDAAQNAARAAGVDTTKYNRLVFVFPNDNGCDPGVGGRGTIGGNPSTAWIFTPIYSFIFGHELGHNLGEHHANFLDCPGESIDDYANCQNIEYGDNSDVMGSPWQLNHFNGPHKVAMGWIPQANIQHITTNGTYTIDKEETTSTNPQVLQIDKSNTDESYFLSYKQQVGYDNTLNSQYTNGASLHVWNDDNFTQTKLIHANPGTPNLTLLDGGTFFDPINGIEIKQINHSTTTATIAIRLGVEITPTPPPPPSESGKIIFSLYQNRKSTINTIFPNGSNTQNFPVKEKEFLSHPVFSSDGKQVAMYFYNTTTSLRKIVIHDYKGNRINELINPPLLYVSNFFFTPDGKSIIVSAYTYENSQASYSIYHIDTNGTNKQVILQPTSFYTRATSISPDGKKILFEKNSESGLSDIFMANDNGDNQENITNTPNRSEVDPIFSPDNQSIAYTAWGTNTQELYRLDLVTKNTEKIPIALNDYKSTPSFSPDGKKIVFLGWNNGKHYLYTINIDGSNLIQVTTGGSIDVSQSAWAPDPDFITPTPTATPSPTPVTKTSPCPPIGDINDDNAITEADHQAAQQIVALIPPFQNPTADQIKRADVSGDGKVTSEDSLSILRYIQGTDSTFKACTAPSPTPAPVCNACSADVSRDGRVSALDYSVMVTCYDKEPTGICANADINHSGIVDIEDYVCVVDHFGETCGR